MVELSRAHEEHIRDVLKASGLPRDAIPYTEEFRKLKDAFWDRAFKDLTDAEFWQAVVNVGKKGGVRGKRAVPGPRLTPHQKDILRRLLPLPLGQRDRLAYTGKLEKIAVGFNKVTGLNLDTRQVWLAVLNLAK